MKVLQTHGTGVCLLILLTFAASMVRSELKLEVDRLIRETSSNPIGSNLARRKLLQSLPSFAFLITARRVGGRMIRSKYTMRQLTKELGVTARTLRHYEEIGLVFPHHRGQTRIYSEEDRARILVVLRGRRVGFTLNEMRQMLHNYDFKDSDKQAQMLFARAKFIERLQRLKQKRKDIEESIQQITGCIAEIDGALQGKPKKPWHTFFTDMVVRADLGSDGQQAADRDRGRTS
jgi:DNA-binding transcriptional MerR regulator